MLFSRSVEYAICALSRLAEAPGGRKELARRIAEEERLPAPFLAKTLQKLARQGWLRSSKGPNGGFRLNRPAAEIRLLDLVEALDGEASLGGSLAALPRFEPLRREILRYLEMTTIADVAAQRRSGAEPPQSASAHHRKMTGSKRAKGALNSRALPIPTTIMSQNLDTLGERLFAAAGEAPLEPRSRAKAAAAAEPGDGWTLYNGSLSRDPDSADILYLAADRGEEPRLLTFRRGADGVVTAEDRPFASTDRESIRDFAERIDRAFLPRPQRDRPAIAVGNRHPEISLPAAFAAFGEISDKLGVNMASTVQLSATRELTLEERIATRTGEDPTAIGHTRVSIEHLYHAGLWAAIRAGWRDGYTAEADHFIVSGETGEEIAASVELVKESIRRAAGYTKFTTDTSRLFQIFADPRHPSPWSDAEVDSHFAEMLTPEEQQWTLAEFSRTFEAGDFRYKFSEAEVRRLAVKFVKSLKLNESLYDYIRSVKGGEPFDFEPSMDEAETLTTPKELLFYMQWLAARGRPATLVPPNLGFKKRQAYPETVEALRAYLQTKLWTELGPRVASDFGGKPLEELSARVGELAAVAQLFDATLSVHSGSGKQAAALESIGRATGGRFNYKISGELQLQLLDVLSEQPEGSEWRALFERMADAAAAFAEREAFGSESALAKIYADKGLQYSLGDAKSGRTDGNLFLVFWIGNLVGTRDEQAPDGDRRFFKEKLDELPAELVAEVRRRNREYVVWLAERLRS